MDKLLEGWKKPKKENNLQACYYQRRHFSMFVLSVDGIIGKESLVVLATLIRIIAAKMDKPILHVTVWVNGHTAIAVTRLYSRVLRLAQSPSILRTRKPEWVAVSGLGLAQYLFHAKISSRTQTRTSLF